MSSNEQQRHNQVKNGSSGKNGPGGLDSHNLNNSKTGFFIILRYVGPEINASMLIAFFKYATKVKANKNGPSGEMDVKGWIAIVSRISKQVSLWSCIMWDRRYKCRSKFMSSIEHQNKIG